MDRLWTMLALALTVIAPAMARHNQSRAHLRKRRTHPPTGSSTTSASMRTFPASSTASSRTGNSYTSAPSACRTSIQAPGDGRLVVSHRVDDQGVYRAHGAETARRRPVATRRTGRGLCPGNARLEVSHGRFTAIRVRDLLNHAAGFVTDDPWGDRQTPLPEAEFTRLLREGVPSPSAPATHYEYSNLGYALLGRIITNVSRKPYADTITRTLLQPLGMRRRASTPQAPRGATRPRLSLGRRRVAHRADPGPRRVWRHGRPADECQRLREVGGVPVVGLAGPRRRRLRTRARATVRELAQGSNFPRARSEPPRRRTGVSATHRLRHGHDSSRIDCDLGVTISSRRWLSGIRIARAAATRPGYRPLRVYESNLRRPCVSLCGRRRSRSTRRGCWARSASCQSAQTFRSTRIAPPARCTRRVSVGQCARAARDELPAGSRCRRLVARTGEAEGRGWRLRHERACRAHRQRSPAISPGAALMAGSRDHCCLRQRNRHASRNGCWSESFPRAEASE